MKKFITKIEFAQLLLSFINSVFAQAMSETEPRLNKKSRTTGEPLPFTKVLNLRDLSIQLGYDYGAQVTKKAESEGITEPIVVQEHSWAKRVAGQLASHKDYVITAEDVMKGNVDTSKLYMPYIVKSIRSQQYFADGEMIAKDILTDYFPPKDNYSSQPAEDKVVVQYMKLSSIKEFTYSGIQYVIK